MGAGGEAHPDINGLAHATHVQGIRVLSVTWDLMSSVVLTSYKRSFIGVDDMVFGGRFGDSVQVIAWSDSVACLEFVAYFIQDINGVQWPAFLQQSLVGAVSTKGWGEQRGQALSS